MNDHITFIIKEVTNAKEVSRGEVIQNLWSNYGHIIRFQIQGSKYNSVVVKRVRFPQSEKHPRGWNSNLSHERKVKSYQVEVEWYKHYSNLCDEECRVAKCLDSESQGEEVLMIFEDLDASGFSIRKNYLSWNEMKACISWLANFHATFINVKTERLWPTGTYWHLETRPYELEVLTDLPLKSAASLIDQKLKECPYQTLVHGDAKVANFCFAKDETKVAAVDFQYVGAGVGVKDLAYFVGSVLGEKQSELMEEQILDHYFAELRISVERKGKEIDSKSLEHTWRNLYPIAWADFHRFLKGWSPGHWKINSYSERVCREVIDKLKKEYNL